MSRLGTHPIAQAVDYIPYLFCILMPEHLLDMHTAALYLIHITYITQMLNWICTSTESVSG